jgi:hypothetical protein
MNDGRDKVRYHVRSDVRSRKFDVAVSCRMSVACKFYVRLLGLFEKWCKNLLYDVTLNNVNLVNSYFSDAKQLL